MTKFTLDSVKQYQELGVFIQRGGIKVARTTERVEELKRRLASAKSWSIDAELISPARIKELVPYINDEIILGGFYTSRMPENVTFPGIQYETTGLGESQ